MPPVILRQATTRAVPASDLSTQRSVCGEGRRRPNHTSRHPGTSEQAPRAASAAVTPMAAVPWSLEAGEEVVECLVEGLGVGRGEPCGADAFVAAVRGLVVGRELSQGAGRV